MNTLYNGDCLTEMKNIPDKSVDLILTDLPYGTTACKWDIIIPFEDLWKEYKRVLTDTGIVALFGDNGPFTAQLIMSNKEWFKYNWIWKKPYSTGFLSAKKQPLRNIESISIFYNLGNTDNDLNSRINKNKIEYLKLERTKSKKTMKEINEHFNSVGLHWFLNSQYALIKKEEYEELQKWTGCFQKSYEEFLKLDKETLNPIYNPQMSEGKPYTIKEHIKEANIYGYKKLCKEKINNGERFPTQVLEFSSDKDKLHPTQKPVSLLEYLIKTYTNEGMIVLDSTMGSGSTGVACVNTNRNFIGIEKDTDYFNIAKKRIES